MGKQKCISIFQSFAYGVIRIVGVGIFILLTAAALVRSQYMLPRTNEISANLVHTPGYHILAIGITFCIVLLMMRFETKLAEEKKVWIERIFLAVSMLWTAGGGFWWINSMDRLPGGDQAFVYGGASYFLEGQYSFLGKGGYCSIYPHQLGLIALMELLFLVVGTYNYFAVEVICVQLAIGIVFLGYCLMKELSVSFAARIFYCLFMMGCVPLICYTSWVYGDIPSIFFAMLTAWFVLRWHNYSHKRYLAGGWRLLLWQYWCAKTA